MSYKVEVRAKIIRNVNNNIFYIFLAALPSDTDTAVQILFRDFPRDPKIKTPPIILRSQIYSMIKEKTVADKELVRSG